MSSRLALFMAFGVAGAAAFLAFFITSFTAFMTVLAMVEIGTSNVAKRVDSRNAGPK